MSVARPFLLEPTADGSLLFSGTYMHSYFDQDHDLSPMSGVYQIDAFVPVSDNVSLVFKIPMIYYDLNPDKDQYHTLSNSEKHSFGNIYLGIGVDPNQYTNKLGANIGLYLPTAQTVRYTTKMYGIFTDFGHYEKYFPDQATLHLNLSRRFDKGNGPFVDVQLGTDMMFSVGDGTQGSAMAVRYGMEGGLQRSNMAFSLEFAGSWLVTEDNGFAEDAIHAMGFGVEYLGNTLQPGVFYSVSVDEDWIDLVKSTLQVRLVVRP